MHMGARPKRDGTVSSSSLLLFLFLFLSCAPALPCNPPAGRDGKLPRPRLVLNSLLVRMGCARTLPEAGIPSIGGLVYRTGRSFAAGWRMGTRRFQVPVIYGFAACCTVVLEKVESLGPVCAVTHSAEGMLV